MSETIARLNEALSGRYAIECELGEGGMATVFLAHDERHDRPIAIKVLKPELAAVIGAERFLSEIKTTANLQHPHILPLHDSGDADGLLFYVMPFFDGESLRDKLDRERQLPVEEAVRLSVDLAEALDYAHRHGVIHRDIKPGNILIHEGRPLIADFGIAKAMSTVGAGRLTETGMSLGTPSYMSPEQAAGDHEVTASTDTYALACVLYEMLVGEPPFTGPTAQAILGKILSEEPTSTLAVRKAVPAHVDAALTKALERLPADRFADTARFGEALIDSSFRYGPDSVGAAASPVGSSRRLAVGALVMLAAVAALAARSWIGRSPPPEVARYVIATDDADAFLEVFGNSLALSPDGSLLVYTGPPDGNAEEALWIKERDQLRAQRIPRTDGGYQPFFFPDGDRIGFVTAQSPAPLRTVSLSSSEVTLWADSGLIRGGYAVDEDGRVYAGATDGNVVRFLAPGSEPEVLTRALGGDTVSLFVDVLPRARGLLFTMSNAYDLLDAQVWVADLESGDERVLLNDAVFARYVSSGHLIFVRPDGSLHAAPFDARELRRTGESFQVAEGIPVGEGSESFFGVDLAVSTSGTLAYAIGRAGDLDDKRLVWVLRDGSVQEIDADWRADFEGVALSRDGSRLAVAIGGEAESEIWLKPLTGAGHSQFTFAGGTNRRPTWTPDGQRVSFISDRGVNRDLYTKRGDGAGEPDVTFDLPRNIDEAHWSSDGEWLVLRTGRSGEERDIVAWRVGTDPADVIPVATTAGVDEVAPILSPDGDYVAYVSNETGAQEVWVRTWPPDAEAGRWRVSLDGGNEPVWARNGRELFYKSQGNLVSVPVETDPTFSRGEEEVLFSLDRFQEFNVNRAYDVSADGERFVMIRSPEVLTPEIVVVENFAEELRRRTAN